MMCVKRIFTDFSTLLTLSIGSAESFSFGAHDASVDTTSSTKAGRCFTNADQLFKIADTISGFL